MAGQTLGDVLRRIGRQAGLQGVLTLTDAQLLERFADGRDEPAFAALMVRHGPMVLGVCRRLLHDTGQAEDAFQAAFLVLARKAGAIQRRALLNAWLYGVAYKVAARLRGRTWRRQAHEKSAADLTQLPAGAGPEVSDLSPALHEEVQRLPDKYRIPVVLCYLEGKTHEQAAAQLRWPVGTVKGRLARAKDMLRGRLARRGLAPSEWALAPALLVTPATAPPALVDATIRAGSFFAGGNATAGGLVSGRVVALTNGVVRTMMLTKLKIAAVVVLALALLGGAGRYAYLAQAGPEDAPKPGARAADKPAPGDKGKDDKEAIQGTWQVSGLETGGKADNDESTTIKSGKWVVTADKITVAVPGQDEHNVSYKLDPTKKPKEIDITPLDGPENEKGKLMPGVYSLEGDVLKICIPAPAHPDRPTEVETKTGGDAMLLILKRQAPGKDKPKEDKPTADKEAIQGTWRVSRVESEGKAVPENDDTKGAKSATWEIQAAKILVRIKGKDKAEQVASYKLDPDKKPKEIDLTPLDGPPNVKSQVAPAVYSLEGGVLKICMPPPNDLTRPTEVGTKEGEKTMLFVLIREGVDTNGP